MSAYISCAVKGKVQATIGDLYQVVLDFLALCKFERVDKIGRTKVLRPLLLARVGINGNDSAGTDDRGGGDAAKANSTTAKDGDGGTLCNSMLANVQSDGETETH